MYSVELKVKRLTLQTESYIIKSEEHNAKAKARYLKWMQKSELAAKKIATFESLYNHRKCVVSPEARASNIAHAYLRGLPYKKVEGKMLINRVTINQLFAKEAHTTFWNRVVDIVYKFGNYTNKAEVEAAVLKWRNQHPQYESGAYSEKVKSTLTVGE